MRCKLMGQISKGVVGSGLRNDVGGGEIEEEEEEFYAR
jgi:hypothetical protein